MRTEEEEIAKLIDIEKREADDFRKRHQERIDRLIERRRELLKRAGANVEDMVRRALIARPEDPRTARLREELEELRRTSERRALDAEQKIRDLTDKLRIKEAEQSRAVEGMKDVTELHRENQMLRERLQLTEKDLLAERQRNEELSRQQAANQQTLLKRLAALESPSIGTTASISTNQSREAKMVKLPSWMRLGK
jgi:Fe-S cluster assembly scaffold protein SufB